MTCAHCGKPIVGATFHDHGKAMHPDCFFTVARARMMEITIPEPEPKQDWSVGLYET